MDDDRLFPIEEFPEVPLVREPRGVGARRPDDARFRNDYPPDWDRCTECDGSGRVPLDGEHKVAVTADLRSYFHDPDGQAFCGVCKGMGSLKAMVRLRDGHRCLRCKHPYMPKGDAKMLGVEPSWREGGWSACDEQCKHLGPLRVDGEAVGDDEWMNGMVASFLVHQGLAVEALWRVLTVHHLDGDKANVRWWNLVSLCQRDHLYIQHKVVMENVYPHEHSEWFKPFVAGYYAFVYLCGGCGLRLDDPEANHFQTRPGHVSENGMFPHRPTPLELTREQVDERLDELLALELAPA